MAKRREAPLGASSGGARRSARNATTSRSGPSSSMEVAVPTVYREMLSQVRRDGELVVPGRRHPAGSTAAAAGASAAASASQPAIVAGGSGERAAASEGTQERPLKRPRHSTAAERAEAVARRDKERREMRMRMLMRRESEKEKERQQEKDRGLDGEGDGEDEDGGVMFEDVPLPDAVVETVEREDEDDDEDDEDGDDEFEDVDMAALQAAAEGKGGDRSEPAQLELNLSAHAPTTPQKSQSDRKRRKPLTRDERALRADIHRWHVLCLIAHVRQRHAWCADAEVQRILRRSGILTDRHIRYLNPSRNLPQFGQTNSLKTALKEVGDAWRQAFKITERGIRRALWAEQPEDLERWELPSDAERPIRSVEDFREAARALQGSRDLGSQLYCALLRSAGVQTRLVCSLQPLPLGSGAPPMPVGQSTSKGSTPRQTAPLPRIYRDEDTSPRRPETASFSSPRRRLGHPNAAAYNLPINLYPPDQDQPSGSRSSSSNRPIRGESKWPVFWVEVLDRALQRWQPADPLVTNSFWNPRLFEPPITDQRLNSMAYVLAFYDDPESGDTVVRDVTLRYAKAFNARTRRQRIDGGVGEDGVAGARWWRRLMRQLDPAMDELQRSAASSRAGGGGNGASDAVFASDLDQIERAELLACAAREKMPTSVSEFKDHPVYALERDLRRREVLLPDAKPAGTVAARGAGRGAAMEKVWRRADVRVARTADAWYRVGRVVKSGIEIPVKWLPKKKKRRAGRNRYGRGSGDDSDDEEDGDNGLAGVPLYLFEQTVPYEPEPVVDGRVPRNRFRNIDVYVPSMVPRGGVHIRSTDPSLLPQSAVAASSTASAAPPNSGAGDQGRGLPARAAALLGVDYAPAVVGFRWAGAKGTAVLDGVVVASEFEEAVRAVASGLLEMQQEEAERARSRRALKTWKRMLVGLRVWERVWGGVEVEDDDDGEGAGDGAVGGEEEEESKKKKARRRRKQVVEESEEEGDVAAHGGGFLVDDAMNADDGDNYDHEHDWAARAGGFIVPDTLPEGEDDGYDEYAGEGGFFIE